jgi:general secretion pathway protein J
VVARVEADLRAALPRRARSGNATEAALSLAPQDAAGDALLVFTRAGPDAVDEAGSGGQRVGYRLRDGRIEALFWPAIDNPATTMPAVFALAAGIRRFQMVALGAGEAWSDRWPVSGEADLPRGLRMMLELSDGTRIERWIALQ